MSASRFLSIAATGWAVACGLACAGEPEIITAARAGDVAKLKSLAASSAGQLEIRDTVGRTAVLAASASLQPKAVEALISLHSDLGAKDSRGQTALIAAIASPIASKTSERDRTAIVAALLKAGSDAAIADADGMTALHWAALRGRQGLLSHLPMGEAAARTRDRFGRTPLHYAAMMNQVKIAEALLQAGADVNLTDGLGETALHTAARRYRSEAAVTLIEHGAAVDAVNKKGETPLMLLAMESNDSPEVDAALVKVAEVLLSHGANASMRDAAGETAVHAAEAREHPKLAELFRKHGGAS